jgi:hypothetical protein
LTGPFPDPGDPHYGPGVSTSLRIVGLPVSTLLLAGPVSRASWNTFDAVDYEAELMFNQSKWIDDFDQEN